MLQTQIQSSCVCSQSSDALNYPSRPPSRLPVPSPHFLSYLFLLSTAFLRPIILLRSEKKRKEHRSESMAFCATSSFPFQPFSSPLMPSVHKSTRVWVLQILVVRSQRACLSFREGLHRAQCPPVHLRCSTWQSSQLFISNAVPLPLTTAPSSSRHSPYISSSQTSAAVNSAGWTWGVGNLSKTEIYFIRTCELGA